MVTGGYTISKFYYGDKVRISNAQVADGAYGTVIGKIQEIDQFSSNKKIVTLFLI